MSYILDPGAMMAAQSMAGDRARSALPNAPLIPDPIPGTSKVHAVRRGVAAALAGLADWVRPYEPKEPARRLVAGR